MASAGAAAQGSARSSGRAAVTAVMLAWALAACIDGRAICRHEILPNGVENLYICGATRPDRQQLPDATWSAYMRTYDGIVAIHIAGRCYEG